MVNSSKFLENAHKTLSAKRKLSPRKSLSLIFVAILCFAALSVLIAIQEPVLGIKWTSDKNKQGLIVTQNKLNNNPHIKAGTLIVKIRSPNQKDISLQASDILEEPDVITEYAHLNRFFERQQIISRHLSSANVTLISNHEQQFKFFPGSRSLFDLPFIFWFQIFCGTIAAITGASIYLFQRGETAAKIYAITGFSLLLTTFISAIYSSRELALSGTLFQTLEALNHLGSMMFTAAFAALFWHYPQRLNNFPVATILFLIYFVIWLADVFQWLPNTDYGIRVPVLGGLLLSFLFATLQWFSSRKMPMERMALKWFILSILLGGSLFVFALFAVKDQTDNYELSQGYSFGLLLIMYLGIALGISRYGLFHLGTWWINIWFWILGGVAVVALDLILISLLHIQQSIALGLSLALAGWLYFPMRQYIMTRWQRHQNKDIETLFPKLVNLIMRHESVELKSQEWKKFLQDIFSPLNITTHEFTPNLKSQPVAIKLDGLELFIPDADPQYVLNLKYPDQGRRLYNSKDLHLADSLWNIFNHTLSGLNSYDSGVKEERKRLARDLHDDIGTRLLSLLHRAENKEIATLAREAMSDLRIVLGNLDGKPRLLNDCIADWRDEWEQRCASQKIRLEWVWNQPDSDQYLNARQYANILRILREILSNIIKHASPEYISFSLNNIDGLIIISIRHNGKFEPPETWKNGRGTLSLIYRIKELEGNITYKLVDDSDSLEISISLPNGNNS